MKLHRRTTIQVTLRLTEREANDLHGLLAAVTRRLPGKERPLVQDLGFDPGARGFFEELRERLAEAVR